MADLWIAGWQFLFERHGYVDTPWSGLLMGEMCNDGVRPRLFLTWTYEMFLFLAMVKEKLYAVVFHIYNVDLKAINTSLIVPQMKYKKMKKSIGERI
jgi:hypothetical protein